MQINGSCPELQSQLQFSSYQMRLPQLLTEFALNLMPSYDRLTVAFGISIGH